MSAIDEELQQQMDVLFDKFASDLKLKTSKLVAKHYAKVLKERRVVPSRPVETSRGSKALVSSPRQGRAVPLRGPQVSKKKVYDDDSDDYSE
jgi:hypothetical protein